MKHGNTPHTATPGISETSPLYIPDLAVGYTWSATFKLNERASVTDITEQLGVLAQNNQDPKLPITGAILGDGSSLRRQVVLGLEPSKNYGTPPQAKCEKLAQSIGRMSGWEQINDAPYEMRTMLGRRIGYDQEARTHDPMKSFLSIDSSLPNIGYVLADVFSVRHTAEKGLQTYNEPGLIIYSADHALRGIMQVAHQLGQEHFVTERRSLGTQVYKHAVLLPECSDQTLLINK